MAEFTEAQIKEIVQSARMLDQAVRRYQRYEESFDLHADAGDNTVDGSRVKPDRILVITHMWAYDATSAPTYIRLGYWNRVRYVWVHIEPAPLVLETVEFHGELCLQEDMWPAIQGNGITALDDIYGGVMGYWVRAPRIS
ncbi:MAG: hypothetical protein KAT75_04255 [Dehalococcoidia bacterium]|nr:hypothetical protein [Dehalococcoidia bacterium]